MLRQLIMNIFGVKFKIVRDKKLDELGLAGQLHYHDKKIVISSSLKGEDYMHTLLHEMFHAVIRRTSIIQSDLHHDLEEIIVDSFATAVCENFKLTKR